MAASLESDSLAGRNTSQSRNSSLLARLYKRQFLHWAYWLGAFSLAAIACLFVWSLIAGQQGESEGEVHSYAIAATLISPGQEVMSRIQFVERPSSYMPEGAISSTDIQTAADYLALGNSVARDFIYPGEAMLSSRLMEPELLQGAVVAIPVSAESRPPLSTGDRVDLFAVNLDSTALAVARSAQVFAIQERSVSVIIKTAEVQAVVSAIAADGIILVQAF